MPRFTRADDLRRHLEKAASALQAETIITAQARLGSSDVSPIDTGRFRSSWFAAEGTSSNAEAPVGTNSPNDDAKGLRFDYRREYHLTNNLPYAQAIALDNRVVSKPTTWFTSFRNSEIPKIQRQAAKQIKAEFEL